MVNYFESPVSCREIVGGKGGEYLYLSYMVFVVPNIG
jgi:hypothetical protein